MSISYRYTVTERFLRYVQIDTQSDPFSTTFPSTEKQKDLARLLVSELQEMGLEDAYMDDYGYVMATIPSNRDQDLPVICLCAHMDTAPDYSGTGVKPVVHTAYDGRDIILPDDPAQVISVSNHPYLREKIGDDIITASGKTLLGADDKAGVAIIMDLANRLVGDPGIPHGTIRLLFTPDEEVGRGVDKLDLAKLGADFGYTLDAGEAGSIESENFSADGMTIEFHGVAAHPGAAKGKMVNALKLLGAFLEKLPKDHLSPETTDDRAGFVHPVHCSGNSEKATVQFILRDFDTARLGEYAYMLQLLADEVTNAFPGSRSAYHVKEQYRNMRTVLDQHPRLVELAEEAIRRVGLPVRKLPIRGGTDGARLSFMGLPCPNLFTGEMALHSPQEYVSVQDMQKSVDMLVELVQLWTIL
ncbi:peptidase T [Flavihumibacter petaseus]|uniref:Peptidase T n=1 Tax=Flavihumibacter petaseus NBRC 106054 TaxID=1220578 RepID=A0A0E9N815_9BACT|nr:peptidase T [Flavihumibacter petaseus]GAO45515.1 peptidase T [Flavihumibacter petaseus NBRC 106054]